MATTPAGHTEYKLVRRTQHKRTGKPLSAFALDLTIRFNSEGAPFVDDHNGDPLVFNNYAEMASFLNEELERNFTEFFGRKP